MERTYNEETGLWALDCDQAHILHRTGSGEYPEIRHTLVKDPGGYEEVAVADIPPYTETEYKAMVDGLIRERYSASDEFALINNVMADATEKRRSEYAAYQEYREECKRKAKETLAQTPKNEES